MTTPIYEQISLPTHQQERMGTAPEREQHHG